jgi:CRISPR system Cascade subunit CasA
MNRSEPSFNLWSAPWITLEQQDGALVQASIEETLLHAGQYRAIYDPAPLVVAGIHRLLTAILQDAFDPQSPADLHRLWKAGSFSGPAIRSFGAQYVHRFDLFAEQEPFLQSADLPRQRPKQGSTLKPVTYLMPDFPAGSEVTHYRHGSAEDNAFCPVCAARGMVVMPAFATSGGAGIKPSINGVPPIYVLPGGETLFQSLMASLLVPDFQPMAASGSRDGVWWRHDPIVEHKATVHEVSYLHGLTFPARRVRLHPQALDRACSRCGQVSGWGVRTMVYQMGESRPKDAPFWFDPFAAYRLRDNQVPVPIRPVKGKALWREFASLFLPVADDKKDRTQPPSVLYQRAEFAAMGIGPDYYVLPFRCIGMRTDMKAKVFEWVDAGFDVPVCLVQDPSRAEDVRQAIELAGDCAGIISHTFRKAFGGEGKTGRHETLRQRMVDAYWLALASPFRDLVLAAGMPEAGEVARCTWIDRVVREGNSAFKTHSEMLGNDAAALRERVTGRRICDIRLKKRRKEALGL